MVLARQLSRPVVVGARQGWCHVDVVTGGHVLARVRTRHVLAWTVLVRPTWRLHQSHAAVQARRTGQTRHHSCPLVSHFQYTPTGHAPHGPLWANMMSSTKPENNVLHCRQRRTEPRPRLTGTTNFVKFGRVVLETCERTDNRQTYRHVHRNISNTSHPTGGEVITVTELPDLPSPPHFPSRGKAPPLKTSCKLPKLDMGRAPAKSI